MMSAKSPFTLDTLVADLRPVRIIRARHAVLMIGALLCAIIASIAYGFGLRSDIVALNPAATLLFRSAALLLIGSATLYAALATAKPGVGNRVTGWAWAALASALLPLYGIYSLASTGFHLAPIWVSSVKYCLMISLSGAAIIATALTVWLRRGAVMEPNRSAMLIGIASGALGTFAYNLYCPSSAITYAAIWYTLCVGISTALGRLILPRFLRW